MIKKGLFRSVLFLLLIPLTILVEGNLAAQSQDQVPTGLSQQQIDRFNTLGQAGNRFIEEGEFTKARDALQQAEKILPTMKQLHCQLGIAYISTGDDAKAADEWMQAIKIDPTYAKVTSLLAYYYAERGIITQAQFWCLKGIHEHCDNPADLAIFKTILDGLTSGGSLPDTTDYLDHPSMRQSVCRWKRNPINVFIEPGNSVPNYSPKCRTALINALDEWTQSSNNTIRWTEVPTEHDADIVCRWEGKPSDARGQYEQGQTKLECSGTDDIGTPIIEHATVTLYTVKIVPGETSAPMNDMDMQRVCLREIGHALGLAGYSPHREDILFSEFMPCKESAPKLSQQDKNTIARLYKQHSPTDWSKMNEVLVSEMDGRGWSLESNGKDDYMYIGEFIPEGQKIADWKEMLTTQTLPDEQMHVTPRQMADTLLAKLKKYGATTQILSETPDSIIFEWRILEPKVNAQYELDKIAAGKQAMHFLHYANRNPDPPQRSLWLKNFTNAHITYKSDLQDSNQTKQN